VDLADTALATVSLLDRLRDATPLAVSLALSGRLLLIADDLAFPLADLTGEWTALENGSHHIARICA
jgi:threonine/homoserine efflux transporter RhtA